MTVTPATLHGVAVENGLHRTFGQVERQQMLAGLIGAIADSRLDNNDDRDLPMIVGVLLACCPQAPHQPSVVAKAVDEAVSAHVRASTPSCADDERSCQDHADECAYITTQLAAGTAVVATPSYAMADCQMLADWLSTAAGR